MSSTPVSSRRSGDILWWTANTFGNIRTRPSISACWATRRSPIPSSGRVRRSPAMRSAPAVPNFHGLSAFVVMSSVAARFFGPQVSGIGATPGAITVFRIDHDEKFNSDHSPAIPALEERALAQLQLALRQRSGGRPGAVRGRELRERAEWDRQHRGRLRHDAGSTVPGGTLSAGACMRPRPLRSVRTDCAPQTSTVPNTCQFRRPARRTTTTTRRASPRAISSIVGVGHDNIFHGDRYKVSARLTVVNLTNKEALYNFISTFSGTHYVSPRAITGMIGFHF